MPQIVYEYKKYFLTAAIVGCCVISTKAQTVYYSVVSVPEESGLDMTQVASDNDCVYANRATSV